MPDVVTLCHVCGGIATNTCKMCGRHVCRNHYDAKTGLCPSCSRGRSLGRKGGRR